MVSLSAHVAGGLGVRDPRPQSAVRLALQREYGQLLVMEQRARQAKSVVAPTADPRFAPYAARPADFIRDCLRRHLWSKQAEICDAVMKHRHVAVASCHGTGKSFLAARIVAWFLSVFPPGEAFAVTTAPSAPQVRAILWREINRAHNEGDLPGRTNQTEWWIGNEMVAYGRKPDDLDPAAFQGIHQLRLLVVLDEACGVPKSIWDAAETLMTNEMATLLAIGNPDDPATEFGEVCKPGSGFHVINISAFDSPNFTGEPVPELLKQLLVTRTWVDERRTRWGEESPMWSSKVLGRFPETSEDTLIQPSWIVAARDRELEPGLPVELGVDVARSLFGDESVITVRRGSVVRIWKAFNSNDLMYVCGQVVIAQRETGATRVKIDDIGLGGGLTDRLKEQANEGTFPAEVVPINVGMGADPEEDEDGRPVRRFVNLRDQMHWALRERYRDGDIDIEADDDLMAQTGSVKYTTDSRGRIKIESKADMKKRRMPSPDRWDSQMLAFAEPPRSPFAGLMGWYAAQSAVQQRERVQ